MTYFFILPAFVLCVFALSAAPLRWAGKRVQRWKLID
jgi:hypothetical protein